MWWQHCVLVTQVKVEYLCFKLILVFLRFNGIKMNIYHRYFAQYMLKNGVSTVDNAFAFCKHVSRGKIENMTQFRTMIIELNREISKQFYKIVFNTCEVTNRDVIVWLNTKNDDISKHQITFSALELEYFHAILQQILDSEEHCITFIVCINITSTLTANFSRDSGQKTLNKWLRNGYYIRNGDFIYLGPRLILEFTSYLRSHCPNSICNLCSELVFTGKKCVHCYKILHSYCLSRYLKTQNKCPYCKNIWDVTADADENEYTMNVEVTYENVQDSDTVNIHEDDTSIATGSHRSKKVQRTQQDSDPGPSLRKRQE